MEPQNQSLISTEESSSPKEIIYLYGDGSLKDLHRKNNFFFLIYFGSLLFYSCYSVERNCKNFHTGSFEFSTLINGEIKTSFFSRTKDLEIETYREKLTLPVFDGSMIVNVF